MVTREQWLRNLKSNHSCSFTILNISIAKAAFPVRVGLSVSCLSVFLCEGERQRAMQRVSGNLTKPESLSIAGRSDPLRIVLVCQIRQQTITPQEEE